MAEREPEMPGRKEELRLASYDRKEVRAPSWGVRTQNETREQVGSQERGR